MVGGKIKSTLMLLMLFFSIEGSAQVIRTILGDGNIAPGASDGNGGQSVNAKVTWPSGVAVDRNGNVYVSDIQHNTVRKIRPDGIILTFAGAGGSPSYAGDNGPAALARLNAPAGLTCDSLGNLYIADAGNHVVRKVDGFGIITTVAGNHDYLMTSSGGDGGPATNAPLGACSGVAFDPSGNLYIANGNDRIRKVTPAGVISTFAGGTIGYGGNGGAATAAAMEGVVEVYADASGVVFVSEQVNNVVRKISTTGVISLVAGLGPSSGGSTGDNNPATAARLSAPAGIKKDAAGNLYICDVGNNRIRKITPAGIISTYSGTTLGYGGDGGPYNASAVKYYHPTSTAFDAAGHMFIVDQGPTFAGTGGGRRLREIFRTDTFHISASPGSSLCTADTVNFTANITSSYYSYVYNWKVNGVPAGTNSRTFHPVAPANGDRISCTLTDTAHSLNLLLAVSDTLTLNITASVTPAVTISSSASDTVCAGTPVTYTANPVNGGITPTYEWMIGGVVVGTGSTYTYDPVNNDTVSVILTSSIHCVTAPTATAFRVMVVRPLPDAGIISGPSTMCPGNIMSLTSSGTSGGTWAASNATATISPSGAVTAVSAGVDTFTYTVTTATCGNASAQRVVTINTSPAAGTISGLPFVCPGSSATLMVTVTGGTWTISNGNATITAVGVINGVSAGADTAIYTVNNSCGTDVARFPFTVGVSSLMSAGTVVGAATVCHGSSVTLSDTATGGFWGTTAPGIASVNSAGIVTGLLPGTASIFYVVASGCTPDTAFHAITVVPVLNAGTITGAGVACTGMSVTLSDTTTGGTWSSSNTTLATVNTSGHVFASSAGTVTISYINGNSCGQDTATHILVITAQPFAGAITGPLLLCVGSSITLADTASGGNWTSSASSIATVNTAGVVTGIGSGGVNITYSVINSCGTDTAIHHLTVNAFPVFTSSAHPPATCSGTLFSYEPASTATGAIYMWNRSAIGGILNPPATGAGDPNEILINTTALPVDVLYLFSASSGGCASILNVTVTVNPIPSLSSDFTVTACSDRTFTYVPTSASPGTSYTWTRAGVTDITPATGSGFGTVNEELVNHSTSSVGVTYVFTLTASGCTATQNISVTIEPQGPPPPAITTHSPSWLCKNTAFQNFGTSTVPDATVTYEWTATNAIVWAQGSTHQYSIVNFPYQGLATIYLSSSVAGHYCSTRDSFTVYVDFTTNETPVVEYFDDNFVAPSGMATYQWGYDDATTLDSTALAGETNSTYGNNSPDFAGKYYWVVTEHLLCEQKTYYSVPTGIIDANAGLREVSVFPNPNAGNFVVSASSAYTEAATITVTDMVGRTVLQMPCTTNTKTDVALHQPAGIYLVSVGTPHGKYVTRITIAH